MLSNKNDLILWLGNGFGSWTMVEGKRADGLGSAPRAAAAPGHDAGARLPEGSAALEAKRGPLNAGTGASLNGNASTNASTNASAALPPGSAALAAPPARFPTVAELEEQIVTRPYRRGVGRMFWSRSNDGRVTRLPPMPSAPTLRDFFALRLANTGNHCLQSANKALARGADEEIVLACLLHDVAQELMCADHGYWGAQMMEPYVSERVTFAIKYHQALRFFADEEADYAYPDVYRRLYGVDFVPDQRLQEVHAFARGHRWYGAAREVTVNDLYAFDPKAVVAFDTFADIVGRHFKQPKLGLGNDDGPVAHMWRTLANPDVPL
ncbi:MAG TPA: hypothetical protein VHZ53_16655 [Steroidobacteraceae bacterium]|jgi:hypothetical protein|nr:hypothetical protein [Steroidobacteraceae bacterium]